MTINKKVKQGIVNKVDSILNNAEHIEKLHIGIFANIDEVPTIRYSVEELIVPVWDAEPDCEECGGDCVLEPENRKCEREKRGEFD